MTATPQCHESFERSKKCPEMASVRFASGPIQYDEPANHEELACKLHNEHRWWRHVPESGKKTRWILGREPEDCYFARHRRELARRSRRLIHRRLPKRRIAKRK